MNGKLNEMINFELLRLVNVLLHSSYHFIFLRTVCNDLNMNGMSWFSEKKDNKCRDSAVKILNWIQENGGYIEFADIAQPKFDESKLDGEFVFARFNDIEKWVKDNITSIQEKIQDSEYKKKSEVLMLLELALSNIMSIS